MVSKQFARTVLQFQIPILVGVALVTLLMGFAATRVGVRTSLLHSYLDQDEYERYRRRAELFAGAGEDFVFVASDEGANLFTIEKLNSLRAAAREMESLPEVKHVFCITELPQTKRAARRSLRQIVRWRVAQRLLQNGKTPPRSDLLNMQAYWPTGSKNQQQVDLAALKRSLLESPQVTGLISLDATAQAMIVQLEDANGLGPAEQKEVHRSLETILTKHGLGAEGRYLAGVVVSLSWMLRAIDNATFVLVPLGAVIVSVLTFVMFRRFVLVFLVLLISAISIVWAIGVTSLAFGEVSVLVGATPLLILAIATSDTVHITSAYQTEIARGQSQHEALIAVMSEVGSACMLTSVTTFVGLMSLMLVPVATMRHFALATAIGVASALILTLLLAPIIYSRLRPPAHQRDVRRSSRDGLLLSLVDACRFLSMRYPLTIVFVHVVLVIAGIFAAANIVVHTDFSKKFSASHPLRRSVEFFNNRMCGATIIEVFVQVDPPEELLAPDTLLKLSQLEERLKRTSGVKSVRSTLDAFRLVDNVIGFDSAHGFPPSAASAAATLELIDGSPFIRTTIVPRDGMARLLVQITPTGTDEIIRCSEEIETHAQQVLGERVEISGYFTVLGRAIDNIVNSQYQSLLLCIVSVTVIIAWGLRSARLGLLSIFPNLLPMVLIVGMMALVVKRIDADLIAVAVLSYGLAVDDTVHFLTRFQMESKKSGCSQTALEASFQYTGRAIVQTTVLLAIGLSPFALGQYITITMLGTYLVLALVLAIVADLLLLPALICLLSRYLVNKN